MFQPRIQGELAVKYHSVSFAKDQNETPRLKADASFIYERQTLSRNELIIIGQRHKTSTKWGEGALESQVTVYEVLAELARKWKLDAIFSEARFIDTEYDDLLLQIRNSIQERLQILNPNKDLSSDQVEDLLISVTPEATTLAASILGVPLIGLEDRHFYQEQINLQSNIPGFSAEKIEHNAQYCLPSQYGDFKDIKCTRNQFNCTIEYFSKLRAREILANAEKLFKGKQGCTISATIGRTHIPDFIEMLESGVLRIPSFRYLGSFDELPAVNSEILPSYSVRIILPNILLDNLRIGHYQN